MKYQIVTDTKISRFEEKINELLNKGWVCQGGISVIKFSLAEIVYHQAMISDRQ